MRFLEGIEVGLSVIRSQPGTRDVQVDQDGCVVELAGDDTDVAELLEELVRQGVRMQSFAQQEPTLEDVFMMVTKGLVT